MRDRRPPVKRARTDGAAASYRPICRPTPPSKVTTGTAFKGASFDYYGQRYRDKFANANVTLELRTIEGALENLRLLQDHDSGVQIAFVTGGVSDTGHSQGFYP